MQVINLKKCPSTQSYLINLLTKFEKFQGQLVLVSTEEQTQGFGQRENTWTHFKNSLAFSFTLPFNKYQHLTPIALGVLLKEYFHEKNINIQLKWPNDLINSELKKTGGVICKQVQESIVCGVGINISNDNEEFGDYGSLTSIGEITAKEIYQYILANDKTINYITTHWNSYCAHMNKNVRIVNEGIESSGEFKGINEFGQATIMNNRGIMETYSNGPLFF
ncbi:MAG: biotin--[acetyl-CoA-carboxylase] ligase [Halobacteriovoraceae bacterium]|nr:biotin--[acetyl-CoA-carboxylase] ligase [Halobacteriovoraceae bacterium]|tara:strand:+ start:310 stop:972 length:663 start_codon:yes stop_codon:yes gene_type:complete